MCFGTDFFHLKHCPAFSSIDHVIKETPGRQREPDTSADTPQEVLSDYWVEICKNGVLLMAALNPGTQPLQKSEG